MSKATHNGTCQICGASQKLPGGRLSQHGYTTKWGFFSGVCTGAHGLPFEQSTDLIERAIKNVEGWHADVELEIAELATATDFVWLNVHANHTSSWVRVALADLTTRPHSNPKLTEVVYIAEGARRPIEVAVLHPASEYAPGTTLRDGLTKRNALYAAHLARVQQARVDYIAWQKARVASWKPSELTPV
jgi:hypothetical protein